MRANMDVGDVNEILVPKQKNTSSGANGRAMHKGSKTGAPNVSFSLVVNKVQLGFLDASNVASGLSDDGVNRVFSCLIIQATDVPTEEIEDEA